MLNDRVGSGHRVRSGHGSKILTPFSISAGQAPQYFPKSAPLVLGIVSSVLSQAVGWEERLRNDVFCVEWDVKP